jgi:hypothetical protein
VQATTTLLQCIEVAGDKQPDALSEKLTFWEEKGRGKRDVTGGCCFMGQLLLISCSQWISLPDPYVASYLNHIAT